MEPACPNTHTTPRCGWRWPLASLPLLACTGCDMLGALFDTRLLRGIVLVVVVLAAVGFLASRAGRR